MAGEKVLVIDDNTAILQFMKNLLDFGGYAFLGVRDGKEGLHKALTEKPDLILLDLVIPEMSGWEFIHALREKQCDIPVILMTAYGSEEIAAKAFSFGVKDYIIKPFQGQEVLTAIDRALTERRLEAERERLTRELRTAYEELQEAQEQMLAAERWAVLGKAADNLAHRINNTAGLIPVVAQDLKELLADVALEEERRQEIDADLQRIERNTRFTLQMADALFKPFEALPTVEYDVNALLEESISVANVPEDVALTTKYADGLPKVVASRLLADVFVELITNAVKSMPDGGQLEIGSRLGRDGWVEVWFSDTGHGIPPESQDKIFDLFFTTSEDSLGFGLWWIKMFLLQQGADIDVESEVGKGATFTVRLPVKGPQAAGG